MRINYVQVGKYRRLNNCKTTFFSTNKNFFVKNLYGNLGITLIAGPNGSGKTSLLSFIAQVFHNLQRFPSRIIGAFRIDFTDQYGRKCSLHRKKDVVEVSLKIDGQFDLPIYNVPSGVYIEENVDFVCYDKIVDFLPPVIIVSAFSLHGEYPAVRPSNFQGDRRLAVYDTSNIYGQNHFKFPSFSRAICSLMNSVREKSAGVKALEELIGAKFTGEVLTYDRVSDQVSDDDEWIRYSKKIEKSELNENIYVNDIRLKDKTGHYLRLSNMSSGQKMLFVRILTILSRIENGALILIEEPEIHLDPAWSRQLVSLLLLFFKEYNAHIIIATHSFSLLNAVPTECVLMAKNGVFSKPRFPTLLANESALSSLLYDVQPHEVEKEILDFTRNATAAQLDELFHQLGESSVRFDIFAQIRKIRGANNAFG
jgi:ABC-type lipoprotein export system ATPase subunit